MLPRRLLRWLTASAAIVIALALTHAGGGSPRGVPVLGAAPPARPAAAIAPQPSLARMIGQRVMARMQGLAPDRALLTRIRRGQVGGVILYGEDISSPRQVGGLVARLQSAAKAGGNPPLLISTDQEGLSVKRLPWAPPSLSPAQMGARGAGVSASQGRQTGRALRAVGINIDLAPVADVAHSANAFIWRQRRSFGMNPNRVAVATTAFAGGMEATGVAPTAKHFPGVGAATVDTDYQLDHLTETPKDLVPYHRLISHGIPVIMVSTGVYRNLDPSAPAALSSAVIQRLLRNRLGYKGVVMTDDLERPTGTSTASAVVRSARAGADIILVSTTEGAGPTAYRALLSAAQHGRLTRSNVTAAYERILALKRRYARY